MKSTETELKEINRQLRLLGQYYKTKMIYREYAKGGKKKDFFELYRSELELYEATTKKLREIVGNDKLTAVQGLKERKAELTEKKQKQYETFKELRTQWMELSKLVKNRDSILKSGNETTIPKGKPTI